MLVCKSVNTNNKIYAGWVKDGTKKPNRDFYIGQGENSDDFSGEWIYLTEKDVPKLIDALQKLLSK